MFTLVPQFLTVDPQFLTEVPKFPVRINDQVGAETET